MRALVGSSTHTLATHHMECAAGPPLCVVLECMAVVEAMPYLMFLLRLVMLVAQLDAQQLGYMPHPSARVHRMDVSCKHTSSTTTCCRRIWHILHLQLSSACWQLRAMWSGWCRNAEVPPMVIGCG